MTRARFRWRSAALACSCAYLSVCGAASAGTLPAGFDETTVFSGLTNPTVVRFAPDGRVLVAEKSGLIKQFSGLGDTSPEIVADLRVEVHNYWDRGLLGMALDPDFVSNQRLFVLYTHDAEIGGVGAALGLADGSPAHLRHLPDAAGADERRMRGQRPALAARP